MAAYLIVTREEPVQDSDEMATYQRLTRQLTSPVKPQPLAVYGDLTTLEGSAPDGVVVMQFNSGAEALEWYEDPSYQQALRHRLAAAKHRAFVVEGV